MASPRKLRYTPSTTQDLTWTVKCGRRRHTLILTGGQLHLAHHSREDIDRHVVSSALGGPPPPSCIQVLLAIRHRVTTVLSKQSFNFELDPQLIPVSVRDAMLVAIYARKYHHTRMKGVDVLTGSLRDRCASRYFSRLINDAAKASLPSLRPVWLPNMSHPTVVTSLTPDRPLLQRTNGHWSLVSLSDPFSLMTNRKLHTFLESWITERAQPHG